MSLRMVCLTLLKLCCARPAPVEVCVGRMSVGRQTFFFGSTSKEILFFQFFFVRYNFVRLRCGPTSETDK